MNTPEMTSVLGFGTLILALIFAVVLLLRLCISLKTGIRWTGSPNAVSNKSGERLNRAYGRCQRTKIAFGTELHVIRQLFHKAHMYLGEATDVRYVTR